MKIVKLGLLVGLIAIAIKALELGLVHYLPRHYVFDAANLQRIAKDTLATLDADASADDVLASMHQALKNEYPDYIGELRADEWVFSNHGSAMGSMVILHSSLTEYLIFYGSSTGSDGHTGMHFADDYFTILYGEEQAALPNATKPERYLPGDQHHLPYGVNKQYKLLPESYALELAQGYIPTMLPFGVIEVLTSTFDFYTLWRTAHITARHMLQSLLKGKI